MHTGIVLAVQADDPNDAVGKVDIFNEHAAHWSDWNEHGGRWSEVVKGAVLRYSDNPERFAELVKEFRGYTETSKNRYVEQLGDVTVKELATNPKYGVLPPRQDGVEPTEEERDQALRDYLSRFWAKRLLEIVDGNFTCDQHFFDVDGGTAGEEFLTERIKNNPDQQFLVVWDYHH
jgi:hypothetical protein